MNLFKSNLFSVSLIVCSPVIELMMEEKTFHLISFTDGVKHVTLHDRDSESIISFRRPETLKFQSFTIMGSQEAKSLSNFTRSKFPYLEKIKFYYGFSSDDKIVARWASDLFTEMPQLKVLSFDGEGTDILRIIESKYPKLRATQYDNIVEIERYL
jgi:hypothetical protein